MGYYTAYTLSVSPHPASQSVPDEIWQNLFDVIDGLGEFDTDAVELRELSISTYTKWYDWEKDMSLISQEFPQFLFTLYGDGEESDDKWVAYFFRGATQWCKADISYEKPNFDILSYEAEEIELKNAPPPIEQSAQSIRDLIKGGAT